MSVDNIQGSCNQAHSLTPITLGGGSEIVFIFTASSQCQKVALSGPYDPPQRFTKQRVGGFHQSSLNSHSRSEPFV